MNNMNMNEMPEMNQQQVDVGSLSRFYSKIYMYVALGILLSGGVAYSAINLFPEQTLNVLTGFPLGIFGIMLLQFALVFLLRVKAISNPALALGGFFAYSVLNGLIFSVILSIYTDASVARAFVSASAVFVGLSIFGIITKKDLSGVGRACLGALFGVIIAMLLNVFVFRSGPMDYLISFLTVIIFAGLTAYDNQRIRGLYMQANGAPAEGIAVFMALQLYLDFINLFLSLLRIFGRSK